MLIEEITAIGGNLKYYGGYTSPPSSYPPPDADYEPITENTDDTKYIVTQGKTIYNSAILIYNNKAYVSLLFSGACNIRGYYNNSAWTNVAAATLLGTCYSIANWSSFTVGGVSVPCISGLMDADTFISSALPSFTDPQDYVDYITNLAQTYTWTSVPAISGKNGILSLTQILNINDGEPVQDITNKGNLDFSKKTKVNTLVNSVYEPTYKEDQTKATIEYEIPEAEYQYTKLVYKKKKIPKSPSDGTAIDIGADDTEAFVSGLDENTTYYFVVFTNRTKSNAYKFKTGKNEAPVGIFFETLISARASQDKDFKETITVTRV